MNRRKVHRGNGAKRTDDKMRKEAKKALEDNARYIRDIEERYGIFSGRVKRDEH